ncbi:AbrB family looped-hinge helix DNA binding protein [Halanaerobium saccharolyticum]|uniref:AbrB family looped-hinge helix DNA binding protein n=1 Tax=Halanaerobium saccharolyticum TaxID=43595 RepID=A0A4R6M2P4_9FIRM|nr:AbrB/MazE/SpoVT family DNA-binding domain-containing protein [Halanaerobium saccharolyticum]TDO94875.1 AbrB family looped-hinge helix DNA binding protein [Halanaerobium saccharolyticum]
MYQVKISSKGQITIPKKLREKLNLNKGDQLIIKESKQGYYFEKKVDQNKIKNYVGILNGNKSSDQLVEELRGNADYS